MLLMLRSLIITKEKDQPAIRKRWVAGLRLLASEEIRRRRGEGPSVRSREPSTRLR
jgi:hypothetical protein